MRCGHSGTEQNETTLELEKRFDSKIKALHESLESPDKMRPLFYYCVGLNKICAKLAKGHGPFKNETASKPEKPGFEIYGDAIDNVLRTVSMQR